MLNISVVSGGCVCGVLRRVRDGVWGVERDGQHHHPGPLVLQRLAQSPTGLAELPAQERRCKQDQEPPHGQQHTAGAVQRHLCHLLPGIHCSTFMLSPTTSVAKSLQKTLSQRPSYMCVCVHSV